MRAVGGLRGVGAQDCGGLLLVGRAMLRAEAGVPLQTPCTRLWLLVRGLLAVHGQSPTPQLLPQFETSVLVHAPMVVPYPGACAKNDDGNPKPPHAFGNSRLPEGSASCFVNALSVSASRAW